MSTIIKRILVGVPLVTPILIVFYLMIMSNSLMKIPLDSFFLFSSVLTIIVSTLIMALIGFYYLMFKE